jgi:hypothetical protein
MHIVDLCHTFSDITELGSLSRAVRAQIHECVEPEFTIASVNRIDRRASVRDNSPVEAYLDFYKIARKGLLVLALALMKRCV